jgi:hypothetical protein
MGKPEMTRDDIIRMAREAHVKCYPAWAHGSNIEAIERFFHMAQASEREAIAQMIEDAPPLVDFCKNEQNGCLVCGFTPKFAAKAIRARGNQ